MKDRIALIAAVLSITIFQSCASQTYSVEMEPSGTKILIGFFDRQDLERDTLFTWFKTNYELYVLDSALLKELEPLKKDLNFVLVLGTWCGDSKHEVPKLCKIFDAVDVAQNDVRFFGVDRSKKSNDGITEKYNIQRVPTLIVFNGELELGRIVENPTETNEKDLLRILKK